MTTHEARIRTLGHLVGNTPMLALDVRFRGRPYRVFAKAENYNYTGSIKDRMALHILRHAYRAGLLTPGMCIAEATSGNTGISFAALGRALGHPIQIFMPDWMSDERKLLIRSLGAETRLVSAAEGGFVRAIEMAEEYAAANGAVFLPRQFENADNIAAHEETTGPEIWWQLHFAGRVPDAILAGVGTGGTIMGAGRYLRSRDPSVRLHPLEPANSPTLRTGHQIGDHRIQGISDEFVPPIVDLSALDAIVSIDDGDAIRTAQRLAAELGLGVGISSGANLLGALTIAEQLGSDGTVVTIFADDNKKYLTTDLMRDEPAKPDHLTDELELLSFEVMKRTCVACCEAEGCERLPMIEAQRAVGDAEAPWCARLASSEKGELDRTRGVEA
jgi:cysteine synthase A